MVKPLDINKLLDETSARELQHINKLMQEAADNHTCQINYEGFISNVTINKLRDAGYRVTSWPFSSSICIQWLNYKKEESDNGQHSESKSKNSESNKL